VKRSADAKAIKKAYRKAALKWHPDRNSAPGAEDNFKKSSEAFQILSDPQKKAAYDRWGKAGADGSQASGGGSAGGGGMPGGGMPGGFGGFGGGMPGGAGGGGFSRGQANSVFEAFFGGGGMPTGGGMGGMGGGMSGMGGMGGLMEMMMGSMGGGGGGGCPFSGGPSSSTFRSASAVRQKRPRSPQRYDVLVAGRSVRVKGLLSASATQYNGRAGTVSRYSAQTTRYTIALRAHDGSPATTLALKRENLDQIVKHCTVVGVASRPEVNGQRGTLFGFDAAKGRYLVELDRSGVQLALKPERVHLPKGTVVAVVGLASAGAAKYNGKCGTIVAVAAEEGGRFTVQLDAAKQLKLRAANMVA
jgi:curved DNA-binding protein CbpA